MTLSFLPDSGPRMPLPWPAGDTVPLGVCHTHVRGVNPEQGSHVLRSRAVCCTCGTGVGYLEVEFDTIFGVEEDERVLRGRPRVY